MKLEDLRAKLREPEKTELETSDAKCLKEIREAFRKRVVNAGTVLPDWTKVILKCGHCGSYDLVYMPDAAKLSCARCGFFTSPSKKPLTE